jgi:hypothetical protein
VPRELASAFVIRYPQLIQAKGIEADGEFLTSLYQPLLQPTLSGGAIEGLGRGLQGANKEGKGGAEPSISNPIPNTNRTETETESELNTENRAQFEQSTPLAEATDPKTDPKPTENEGEADPRADPKANLDATDSETAKKRQDVAESELDKPWIRKTWQDLAFCLKIDLGNPNPIDARQAKQDSEYLFKLLEIVCREAIVKNKKLSKQRELLMQMAREIHSCKQKAISPMAVFRDKCQAIWPDPSEERKQDIKNPLRIGA